MNPIDLSCARPLDAVDTLVVDGDMVSWQFRIDKSLPVFAGHYPNKPIFPGVFAVDSILQACANLFSVLGEDYVLAQIKHVRFLVPFIPGDVLQGELVHKVVSEDDFLRIDAGCYIEGKRAVTAVLIFCKSSCNQKCVIGETEILKSIATQDKFSMEHQELKRVLPHRFPMLLVDRVCAGVEGKSIIAEKAISGAEACFQRVSENACWQSTAYPKTLLIESFCQSAGLLAGFSIQADTGKNLLFGYMKNILFNSEVYPGDVVRHYVTLEKRISDSGIFSGRMEVAGKTIGAVEQLAVAVR